VRATKERPGGRPMAGTESKYLLTGFAACADCGGSLIVRSRDYRSQRRYSYRCAYNFQHGRTVCINALEVPLTVTDREVLTTVERAVLAPEVIERTIRRALAMLAPADDELSARRARLQQSIGALEAELTRLTDALARGGDLDSLLGAIKDREGRRAQLLVEWTALDAVRLRLRGRPSTGAGDAREARGLDGPDGAADRTRPGRPAGPARRPARVLAPRHSDRRLLHVFRSRFTWRPVGGQRQERW